MTTILLIQRAPAPPSLPILLDSWTAAHFDKALSDPVGDQWPFERAPS
jgi:hypothetical protein